VEIRVKILRNVGTVFAFSIGLELAAHAHRDASGTLPTSGIPLWNRSRKMAGKCLCHTVRKRARNRNPTRGTFEMGVPFFHLDDVLGV